MRFATSCWTCLVVLVGVLFFRRADAQGFVEVTSARGLAGVPAFDPGNGLGACAADFDGDGDQDLLVPGPFGTPIRFYRNVGGTFVGVAGSAGLPLSTAPRGCAVADVDRDGDLDALIANWRFPAQLLINDGTGVFTEEAQARGLVGATSAFGVSFGDFDRDGWIDLYVANRATAAFLPEPNRLFRNVQGSFVDVSAGSGADLARMTFTGVFVDVDDDGWPDLLCANDLGPTFGGNTFLRNSGNGTFQDLSCPYSFDAVMDGMGVDLADVGDGALSVYVTDTPPDHLFLTYNQSLGAFQERTAALQVGGGPGLTGWACQFFDWDNDGFRDLHVLHHQAPPHAYQNPGGPGPWTETAASLGLTRADPQFVALTLDFDDDGGVDLLQRPALPVPQLGVDDLVLMRNQLVRGGWLTVALRGTESDTAGIGAVIEAEFAGRISRHRVTSGTGFLGGSDLRAHFGLGAATGVDRLTVRWPSGTVQVLGPVAGNQVITVVEPRMNVTGTLALGTVGQLTLESPNEAGRTFAVALAVQATPGWVLGTRVIPLNPDALFWSTLTPGNPWLPTPLGVLTPSGVGGSSLLVPQDPSLTGLVVHGTGVTLTTTGALGTTLGRATRLVVP